MGYELQTYPRGRLIVSMDFEIGWGSIENALWRPRERAGVYSSLRPALRRLVDELDVLDVPMTWATVGAMVSDPKAEDFEHLPASSRDKTRAFLREARTETRDGRDLYEMVAGARTPQDIGSHTFSHTRFSYPDFDEAGQSVDMSRACAALGAWGATPRSFVYPLNHASSTSPLKGNGFKIARVAPLVRSRSRVGRMIAPLISAPPLVAEEKLGPDFTLQSGSMFYNWGVRADRLARRAAVNMAARRGLQAAQSRNGAFHIWLHPFNLSETAGLLDGLMDFLRSAAQLRDAGRLDIATMMTPGGRIAGVAAAPTGGATS